MLQQQSALVPGKIEVECCWQLLQEVAMVGTDLLLWGGKEGFEMGPRAR